MRIALVGTRGVPARYGGFETCVEQVGLRLVKAGHEVVVYCRTRRRHGAGTRSSTRACGSSICPRFARKSLETLSHTAPVGRAPAALPVDAAIVFNSANAPFLPVLRARGIPVATHVDGLEWKRSKWQGAGRRYYRLAESMAVRWSDALIADAQGIADYYAGRVRRRHRADRLRRARSSRRPAGTARRARASTRAATTSSWPGSSRRTTSTSSSTATGAARAKLPLVVVGLRAVRRRVHRARSTRLADDRVRFLGGVWDQDLLDQLYANCATYLHGHSVGGTNPSLLRAIGAGAATIAYDVNFNREVVADSGRYFRTADDVAARDRTGRGRPGADPAGAAAALSGSRCRYDWDDVAERYEGLCERLAAEGGRLSRAQRPRGRRNGIDVDAPIRELRATPLSVVRSDAVAPTAPCADLEVARRAG